MSPRRAPALCGQITQAYTREEVERFLSIALLAFRHYLCDSFSTGRAPRDPSTTTRAPSCALL
jgi:hypothetical protein